MPAPPETDLAKIRKYCQAQVPDHLHDQIRIEVTVRGSSVTILESRPLWQASQAEWSQVRVAQLRYSATTNDWSLYWADRNSRWHRYYDLPPSRVDQVLREIESDPTGIFWG